MAGFSNLWTAGSFEVQGGGDWNMVSLFCKACRTGLHLNRFTAQCAGARVSLWIEGCAVLRKRPLQSAR